MDIFAVFFFLKFFIVLILKTALLKKFHHVLLFNVNEGSTLCVCTYMCICTHAMYIRIIQESRYVYM